MSERIHFGKIREVIKPPNLIGLQLRSYEEFFQKNTEPSKRKAIGLQAVFQEFFPILGFEGKSSLDFVNYEREEPKIGSMEAQREGQTYSTSIYVTFIYQDERITR